jgi:parallel beta-helix repeat protein
MRLLRTRRHAPPYRALVAVAFASALLGGTALAGQPVPQPGTTPNTYARGDVDPLARSAVQATKIAQLVCDNATDNAAAIAALNAVTAGTVFFPPAGQPCLTSVALAPQSGVTLAAWPGTVTLKPTAGSTANPVLFSAAGVSDVLVDGLGFDGALTTLGNSNNVAQVYNSTRVVFDRAAFQNTRGIAVLISTNVKQSGVRRSRFVNVGNRWLTTGLFADQQQGVAFCCGTNFLPSAAQGGPNTVVTVASTTGLSVGQLVSGTGLPTGDYIQAIGAGTVTLTKPSLVALATSAALTATGNDQNFATDNYLETIGLDAISFTGQTHFVASNNRCNNVGGQVVASLGGACIYGYASDIASVNTNTVAGAIGNGLDLARVGHSTIQGNSASRSGGSGISFASADVGTVTGNTLLNNHQDGIASTGASQAGIFLGGGVQVGNPPLSNVTIVGNTATDDQTTPTQTYGIQEQNGGTYNNVLIDSTNLLTGNANGPFGEALKGFTAAGAGTSDNRVLNPCMALDQRNEGAFTLVGGSQPLFDGWSAVSSSTNFNYRRVPSSLLPGCQFAAEIRVTISGAPTATQYFSFFASIEAQNLYDLQYGTSAARNTILDFCVNSPGVTGTFTGSVLNPNGPRSYPFTYAVTTAGVTQCYSLSIPGDTGGYLTNTPTGTGLQIQFNVNSGANQLSSVLNSWQAGQYYGGVPAGGLAAFGSAAPNTLLYLSSVRFYPANQDTAWIPRAYSQELALAQRYLQKSFSDGVAPAPNAGAAGAVTMTQAVTGGAASAPVKFPASMRVAPTVTRYSTGAASANCYDITTSADVGAASAVNIGTGGMSLACAAAAGAASGNLLAVHYLADAHL